MGNLFESFSHPDSIAFLLSVLVSFLIGFITAWVLWSGRAKRLQRELDALQKKFNALEAEAIPLRQQLDLKEADLVRATREAGEAIFHSRTLESEKEMWQADLETAHLETASAQATAHSYAATVDDLNHEIIGLKTMVAQLTEEKESDEEALALATTAAAETSAQTATNDAFERLSALENRLNLLNAENEALKQQVAAEDEALGRLSTLESRLNLLSAENEALKVQVTAEHEEPAVDDSWYDQVTVRFNGMEEKLSWLSDENESLKTELASLKDRQHFLETVPETPLVVEIFGETEDEIEIVPETHEDVEVVIEEEIIPGNLTSVSPVDDAKIAILAALGGKIPFATASEKDDLTLIKGIGSFIEQKLNGLGIYTFEQISRFDADLIEKVTAATEFFPGRIERDDWVGQAALLANNDKLDTPVFITLKQRRDLKIVEGIGPKIEKLLKGAGIKTLEELADASEERLREILLAAGEAYRIHDPATWAAQADLAAKGEWEKLKQYQDALDGGREKF